MTRAKKVFIRTFGCQMNEYDSDKMADVLAAAEGYEKTDTLEDADLILFNTCSVREKAQEKVFADLGRVRPLKAAKPGLMIGVGGCVASQEGAEIVRRAPFVDLVFGPQTLHRLPELLAHRARVEEDHVRILGPLGQREALGGVQHVGHLVRVVLVHLAAERADVELLCHCLICHRARGGRLIRGGVDR